MAERPINPGSLADFEAAGRFDSREVAEQAYFDKLHEFRLAQAVFFGIDETDLHDMKFSA